MDAGLGGESRFAHIRRMAVRRAVEDFIHEQSLTDPILGGHSIGGKLAMLSALRYPERVPALISIFRAL